MSVLGDKVFYAFTVVLLLLFYVKRARRCAIRGQYRFIPTVLAFALESERLIFQLNVEVRFADLGGARKASWVYVLLFCYSQLCCV